MSTKQSRRGFIKGAGLMAGGLMGSSVVSAEPAQSLSGSMSKGAQFRALLARPEPLLCPAVHDVLTGRLCEMEGFQAVTTGGSAASSAVHGIPDFGLISITELIEFAGNVAQHINIPVLGDGDDAGGSPNNAYRATQNFEKAGVGAIMYEDTVQVKHLTRQGGELVTKEQMADKIKAAVDARKDQNLVIVARCDAIAEGHTMDDALARGVAYAEAGADVLFFSGMRLTDTAKARDLVKRPLMTTVNSTTTPDQLKEAKISLAVYAGILLNVATGAAHQVLKELKATGKTENSAKMAIANDIYTKLIGSQDYIDRGKKYHLTKG